MSNKKSSLPLFLLQFTKTCLILSVIFSGLEKLVSYTAQAYLGYTEANPLANYFIHTSGLLTAHFLFFMITLIFAAILWIMISIPGQYLSKATFYVCMFSSVGIMILSFITLLHNINCLI